MEYTLTLKTAPTTEPLTLAEVKDYLKISDLGDTSSGLTISESILIASRNTGTVNGTSVDITGYTATVELNVGTLLAGGKLNVKIQESADNATWVDWYSFTEVTTANDNDTFKYQYTGSKQYIRVVGVLTVAGGDYAANIILNQGYTDEDTYLTSLITVARQYCEDYQNRAYITQTWEMSLPEFPYDDAVIEIPKGNLQSISSIKYKDYAGTETTLVENTDYIVSTRGVLGKICPTYGDTWPVFTPYPLDAVIITFVCGYGAAAAVPEKVIQAMKLLISHWFVNRIPINEALNNTNELSFTLSALLWQDRIVIL